MSRQDDGRLIILMGYYVKLLAAVNDDNWARVKKICRTVDKYLTDTTDIVNPDYDKGRRLLEGCIKEQDSFTMKIYVSSIIEMYGSLMKKIFSNGNAE